MTFIICKCWWCFVQVYIRRYYLLSLSGLSIMLCSPLHAKFQPTSMEPLHLASIYCCEAWMQWQGSRMHYITSKQPWPRLILSAEYFHSAVECGWDISGAHKMNSFLLKLLQRYFNWIEDWKLSLNVFFYDLLLSVEEHDMSRRLGSM